jgi:xanthine dehydrogenase accessory factor
LEADEPAVARVLVTEVRGSAPREAGTCMLVTHTDARQTHVYGTIGGGHLELQATHIAAALLEAPHSSRSVEVRELVLGRELAQCCGGVVHLWIERFTREDLPLLRQAACAGSHVAILTNVSGQGEARRLLLSEVTEPQLRLASMSDAEVTLIEPLAKPQTVLWLYGAGHVGHALIHLLADLPFQVTWLDSRPQLLPDTCADNVHSVCSSEPSSTVSSAPAGTLFLVMTHDHAMDYEICRKVLERRDFGWLGLIGSKSKGARFRSRLARAGLAREQIARLTCPIGIEGVQSKLPAAIAVAVAAQLLGAVGSSSVALPLSVEHGCDGIDCKVCAAAAHGASIS